MPDGDFQLLSFGLCWRILTQAGELWFCIVHCAQHKCTDTICARSQHGDVHQLLLDTVMHTLKRAVCLDHFVHTRKQPLKDIADQTADNIVAEAVGGKGMGAIQWFTRTCLRVDNSVPSVPVLLLLTIIGPDEVFE